MRPSFFASLWKNSCKNRLNFDLFVVQYSKMRFFSCESQKERQHGGDYRGEEYFTYH